MPPSRWSAGRRGTDGRGLGNDETRTRTAPSPRALVDLPENVDEVDGEAAPGDVVDVRSAAGDFLGRGYYNPRSQIAIRLLAREPEEIDYAFFVERIRRARAWRERWMPEATAFRLVYSEGDLLPGLIVDRYEDVLVAQFLTLGMDVRRDMIVQALREVEAPAAIYERSDVPSRRYEGLEERTGLLWGSCRRSPW